MFPRSLFPVKSIFLACAIICGAAAAQENGGPDVDRSVKPGDDFYRYANQDWLRTATIPPGQSSFDTRAILKDRTSQRVRALVEGAAANRATKGSIGQKVGDYYASFMNTDEIEAKGLAPLAAEQRGIASIADKPSLSAYLGTTLNSEIDGLTANADHVFGIWINQGFEDARHNLPHIWQGGLGLPDRDNYLDASPKAAELLGQYKAHIAAVLKMAGTADVESKASQVLALETKIARAFAPDAEAADTFKQNNSWNRADFASKAPGMDWNAYFKSAGLDEQPIFVVWQPSAVTGVSALVASESLDAWKDYLTFHLIEHYYNVMPKAERDEHFAFYGKMLVGAQKVAERGDDAMAATNGGLGQAVGQLYTQKYFSSQAKARAQEMAANLLAAFRARISNLAWLSPPTKEKALAKLAALKVIVGYPDNWIDDSTLDVVRGDAVGNMRRVEAFNRRRNLARLNEPVEPIDWPINPQTPGAVIMFSPNAEFFTAGILQTPYFDSEGHAASNYGSAGAGMAHEISHSFDELGNIYDEQGRLVAWWTASDKAEFHAAADKLVAQLNGDCPLADACVDGKQVLTETVADLAGLLVAHDAYLLSLRGNPDVVVNGLSGEQRFFLAFAQRWRRAQNEASLRRQIKTDTHLPGEFRSDLVRNVDAWYQAFDVKPGDKLYLKPEDRIHLW
ncbi:MAG: M13 family metallopeptidase [Candidatus Sulfotelmatobacter sp.]